MALLQLSSPNPFGAQTDRATLTESQWVTNPIVHAIAQPVSNVITETHYAVSGLGMLTHSVVNLAPYFLAGWLVWTAADMYLPSEMRALERGWNRAAKRMRLR